MNEVPQIKTNTLHPQTNQTEQEEITVITALGVKGHRQLVQAAASILKAVCGNERRTKA